MTAAVTLLRKPVTLARLRGTPVDLPSGGRAVVTVHPSFVLRQRDDASRKRVFGGFVDDLVRSRSFSRRFESASAVTRAGFEDTAAHRPNQRS